MGAKIPKCYALTGCTAPAVRVELSQRGESVDLDICALHISETRALGFTVAPLTGAVTVTSIMPPEIRTLAISQHAHFERGKWTELAVAPREWCNTGCKVHAALTPAGHMTFSLRHYAGYGCPAGPR